MHTRIDVTNDDDHHTYQIETRNKDLGKNHTNKLKYNNIYIYILVQCTPLYQQKNLMLVLAQQRIWDFPCFSSSFSSYHLREETPIKQQE